MVISLLSLLLFGVTPLELKSEGALSPLVDRSSVQSDGTILLNNKTKVHHLNAQGEEIRVIGRDGFGPGEFKELSSITWDGRQYVFYDTKQKAINILNAKGQFLNRINANIRMFQVVDDRLFFLDLRPFIELDYKDRRALIEVEIDDKLQLHELTRFYIIDDITNAFKYNYKLHFVCRLGDNIYVLTQLNNVIYQFTLDLKFVTKIPLALPEHVQSKQGWPEDNDREKGLKLLARISYITRLCPLSNALAVAYTKPKPSTNEHIPMVQLIDVHGKNMTAPLMDLGVCIGSYQDKLYFLKESSGLKYQLLIWDRG